MKFFKLLTNKKIKKTPKERIDALSDIEFIKLLENFGKQEQFLITNACRRAAQMLKEKDI